MKEKVEQIKIAYTGLSWDERKEVRDFIENFEKKEISEKRQINEQLRKSLGPINSGKCDWCGK